ncbi:hypothetical protein [Agromyces sp. Marseille-Q5079]|uniref:hypothetical protein n=1 Tax=Agromyces sp. Marseille-Q5079 TaxID=3439059 RepID=UPI003D9C9873
MSDTSTNAANPAGNRDEEDWADLPMTRVEGDEVASERGSEHAPETWGFGIAGEPPRLSEPNVERGRE